MVSVCAEAVNPAIKKNKGSNCLCISMIHLFWELSDLQESFLSKDKNNWAGYSWILINSNYILNGNCILEGVSYKKVQRLICFLIGAQYYESITWHQSRIGRDSEDSKIIKEYNLNDRMNYIETGNEILHPGVYVCYLKGLQSGNLTKQFIVIQWWKRFQFLL